MEALLAGVEAGCGDGRAGLFGPHSMSWKINRESVLFLGAGRAALLQLAHPWVAAALREHSSLLADPIARFHNTFRVVFTMVFGSCEQALTSARGLHTLHARIRGELPEPVGRWAKGSHYEANEIDALRWVFATLVESALLAYEWVLPRLDEGERERYYAESKTMAALFGIPAEALPAGWREFAAYCEVMAESDVLGVTQQSREMAHNLLCGAGSWIRPPRWYRAQTAAWMPERLREALRLTLDAKDMRAAARAQLWLRRVYRAIPPAARFVGPYREAERRLQGKRIGLTVRWGNRFWIGQGELPPAMERNR